MVENMEPTNKKDKKKVTSKPTKTKKPTEKKNKERE
jgi:hypothetical protein